MIPVVFLLPETYAPVLLTRRAQKLRKADPTVQVYAAFELEEKDIKQVVTKVLTRPIRMLFTELIVTATCLYLALVYAVGEFQLPLDVYKSMKCVIATRFLIDSLSMDQARELC